MNLSEFLEVLWRRKLIVIGVTLVSLGVAFAALQVTTKQYEATSTLAVLPTGGPNSIYILSAVDQITPIYADAATAPDTLGTAQRSLPNGESLAGINVRTFTGTPIIKVVARDPSPKVAQDSAQAVSQALLGREAAGELKVPQAHLEQYNRPTLPSGAVYPRPKLTMIVAFLIGLGLGVGAALLRENLATKIETPEALARVAGVPSYAEIPNEPALARVHAARDLTDPKFRIVAEALRDLRTNLLFTKGNLRSIVITSPEGSHGKTTVSFGLAVSVRPLRRADAARRRRPAQGPRLGAAERAAHAGPLGDPARPSNRRGHPAHVARQPRLHHRRQARRGPGRAADGGVPEPAAPVRADVRHGRHRHHPARPGERRAHHRALRQGDADRRERRHDDAAPAAHGGRAARADLGAADGRGAQQLPRGVEDGATTGRRNRRTDRGPAARRSAGSPGSREPRCRRRDR